MKLKTAALTIVIIIALSVSASAQTVYVTKGGYVVTSTRAVMDLVIQAVSRHDDAALQGLLQSGIAAMIVPGLRVYLEESTWGGLVRFTPVGSSYSFWTVREALRRE
jgi:hypothetical protein